MRYLSEIRLTDYRNYERLDLTLGPSPVVLFGRNGAGKTNLLEAISLLTPGRGLRRAAPESLALSAAPVDKPLDLSSPLPSPPKVWGVASDIMTDDGAVRVGIGAVPGAPRRKTLRIGGKSARGTDLARLLTIMWLTPAQDRLFTGPASDRRRFLDRFCLTHFPDHGQAALRYEKSRMERNRLLADGVFDDLWFDALEADMAQYGAAMAFARAQTIAALRAAIESRPEGAFPKALIALSGEAEQRAESGESQDELEQFIAAQLSEDRGSDRRAGRTRRGVHKSDLLITHSAKHMPAKDCSTGEQKALLIGLVLAHARAQAVHAPIILLDEVAAHLDVDRRAALIEELLALKCQVFMTGTDSSLFEAFAGRAQMFEVSGGDVIAAAQA